jgi:hypothetical protein
MAYEPCALCGQFYPSAAMDSISVIIDGHTRRLRFCQRCVYPQTMYIQGGPFVPAAAFSDISIPQIVSVCLILAFAALVILFSLSLESLPRAILLCTALTIAGLGTIASFWRR